MNERNMKKGLIVLVGLYAVYVFAAMSLGFTVMYVIAHFIGKYW